MLVIKGEVMEMFSSGMMNIFKYVTQCVRESKNNFNGNWEINIVLL